MMVDWSYAVPACLIRFSSILFTQTIDYIPGSLHPKPTDTSNVRETAAWASILNADAQILLGR